MIWDKAASLGCAAKGGFPMEVIRKNKVYWPKRVSHMTTESHGGGSQPGKVL